MAPPELSQDGAAVSAWSMVLDVMERDVLETEQLLAELANDAAPDPTHPETPSSAVAPWPAPAALLAAVVAGHGPAELARAHALFARQQRAVHDLQAALSVLRRHRDLMDTMATPPARPRYFDQLS